MKKYFLIGICLALLLTTLAGIAAAIRPMLLTALINGSNINTVLKSTPIFFFELPVIYLVLTLEVLDFLFVFSLGILLSYLSANIGRDTRIRLAESTLRHFSGYSEEYLSKYTVLTKTYIDVIELFVRQYFFQSIGALINLIVAILMAYALSTPVAVLLGIEIFCLILITTAYSQLHMKLADARFKADEELLGDSSNNPRKGISIWFGGLGDVWLKQRRKEILVVRNARLKLAVGDSIFLNTTTFIIGISVVIGYFILIILEYGTTQDFVAFFLYSGFMMGPVARLASFVHECQESYLAICELRKATSDPCDISTVSPNLNPMFFTAKLQSETHSDIIIRSGDRLAVTGHSGSGKTTFIETLLGAKNSGTLNPLISGHPSKSVRHLLPQVGLRYLSDTPVFERGTVLFNCHADSDLCLKLSKKLGLFNDLDDQRCMQLLGKNILATGEPLSLGERQRIQLLRTLIEKPKVLILDEALSGIDEYLEKKIISYLLIDTSIEILIYIGHRKSIQDLFKVRIAL